MTPSLRIVPRPHWWGASTLSTLSFFFFYVTFFISLKGVMCGDRVISLTVISSPPLDLSLKVFCRNCENTKHSEEQRGSYVDNLESAVLMWYATALRRTELRLE